MTTTSQYGSSTHWHFTESWRRFPAHWSVAAWLWLDLPTFMWWLGLDRWHTLWRSPAAVVFQSPTWDHVAAALWYALGLCVLVASYRPLTDHMKAYPRANIPMMCAMIALATLSFPFVSHDLFVYYAEWRVMAIHHVNPMLTPVSQIPYWRHDTWLALGGWQKTVNPYGPAWFLLVRTLGGIAPHFVGFFIVWKTVALLSVLTTAWFVERLVKNGGGLRYLFHPVVSVELLSNAHNDTVMMALAVLAYLLWTHRRWTIAGVIIGASIATKYISGIVWAWMVAASPDFKSRLSTCLGAIIAGLGLIIPFWHGPKTLFGPLGAVHLFLRSPAFVIQGTLVHLSHMPRGRARHWAFLSTTTLFVLIYLFLSRQFSKSRDPIWIGDALLAAALVLMSWMQFWYISWSLPFYLLSRQPRATRMVSYLAGLELVRALGWPLGLPADIQIMETVAIWGGLIWAIWPLIRGRFRMAGLSHP